MPPVNSVPEGGLSEDPRPQYGRGDADGQHITGHWSHTDAQRMADRMQGKIERAAPGSTDRILARRILTLNYPGLDAHLVTCVRTVGRHRVERSSRLRVRPAGVGRGSA